MKQPSRPTCRGIRATGTNRGRQRTTIAAAISSQSVGARGICMHLVTIPAGGRAKAHLHQDHETSIYTLSGQVGVWYGDQLKEHLTVGAGDFLYIPANMPHLPYNLSQTEPAVAVVARTDPNEQESVVLLPHLEQRHAA